VTTSTVRVDSVQVGHSAAVVVVAAALPAAVAEAAKGQDSFE